MLQPKDLYDCVGYESLTEYIERKGIYKVKGDFVEVGTLFGGGAKKLSVFLSGKHLQKKLYVIDIFDINTDGTITENGVPMDLIYRKLLKNLNAASQLDVFSKVTAGCNNIRVLKGDSAKIRLPARAVAFAFIDGNHSADYVESDFRMIWKKLSPSGVVAFHDYRGSIPEVTRTVDSLMEQYRGQIKSYEHIPKKTILFIQKK